MKRQDLVSGHVLASAGALAIGILIAKGFWFTQMGIGSAWPPSSSGSRSPSLCGFSSDGIGATGMGRLGEIASSFSFSEYRRCC